jgi:hypothetical protein
VQSQIARSGSAVAVPVKTREWFPATAPQLSSQNICTHTCLLAHRFTTFPDDFLSTGHIIPFTEPALSF